MSNSNIAGVAPATARPAAPRSLAAHIAEFLHTGFGRISAWRQLRREREELYEYLASDHRAAADIGYRHRRP